MRKKKNISYQAYHIIVFCIFSGGYYYLIYIHYQYKSFSTKHQIVNELSLR